MKESMDTKDVTIIGGGPAGLVSALELQDKDITLIEKGTRIEKRMCPMTTECKGCARCGEVEGIGGAGGWSDGKLCLGPVGILDRYIGENYTEEVQMVNNIFREMLGGDYVDPNECADLCNIQDGVTQEVSEVANLGSSLVRLAFQRMHQRLLSSGKDVLTIDRVVDVRDSENGDFVVTTKSGRQFISRNVIVATGKCDFHVVPQLVDRYRLETMPNEPTLGFRLAIPNEELAKMKMQGNNPKLKLHLPNGDTVKTHCFCFGGEVMAYVCGDYFLVGGRADAQNPTSYANSNILYKFSSGDLRQKKELVHHTLRSVRADHPQNVLYQDLVSFLDGDQDPMETAVPACRGGKLGSLLPYLPNEIVDPMRQFIRVMVDTYGMDPRKATIFGPASEWLNDAVVTSMEMETARKGLYMTGDGSGITQGIISAAVTGYRAAHSILGRGEA